jgi:uncharacterized protein
MLPIEMDLRKIERLSIQRDRENFQFRAYLKNMDPKAVDRVVYRLHKIITAQINCLDCGNCCNSLVPRVTDEEIAKLAGIDNISVGEFEERHLEEDKSNNSKFLKAMPCRYLEGKSCTVYENRPAECRSYPHTYRRGFIFRTLTVIANYAICPIVFNLLENLKKELDFKPDNG